MKTPACSFVEARNALMKALTDYQTATLEMSLALQRLTNHNTYFYQQLDKVVRNPVVMSAQRR